MNYTHNPDPKKSVRVFSRGARVSEKNSIVVCREITGMSVERGKKLLEDMIAGKRSLDGKYYTNACKEILSMIKLAEKNAETKGLDVSKMKIHATAHNSFRFWRPRRFRLRGQLRKMCNLQVVLEVR